MKTKAAFTSFLGLTLVTSILVGSTAEAQVRTSLAPRKTTAKSQLKAKVSTAAPAKAEDKSRFGMNISGTYYGKEQNESNWFETWITGSFKISDSLSFSLDTGFDAYMEKQEDNQGYDLEANLVVTGIEIAKDFTFTPGLIGVAAVSRDSREKNMAGAYGARANFGLKLGGVSLGLDNNFYQIAYKEAPIATPEADFFENDDKRFYGNEYTRATTVLSVGIPVGPVKFKNDLRYRQSTPYEGEETRTLRYRPRISYGIMENLSVTGGLSFQQKLTDPKRLPFFNSKNRMITFNISLDV